MKELLNMLSKGITLTNKFIYLALILIFSVALVYFGYFSYLGSSISEDPTEWAELGTYFGGLLGPILSFMALVLLIKSLNLQNEANQKLKEQLENSERTEKLKTFESLFFHMVLTQKEVFDSFKVSIKDKEFNSINAVLEIDKELEKLRSNGAGDKRINCFLEKIDSHDHLYSISRAFFIIVKLISQKLSDQEGFSIGERKTYIETLINFTDFNQLQLIMICMQFLDYYPVEFLKEDIEFNQVLNDIGLKSNNY